MEKDKLPSNIAELDTTGLNALELIEPLETLMCNIEDSGGKKTAVYKALCVYNKYLRTQLYTLAMERSNCAELYLSLQKRVDILEELTKENFDTNNLNCEGEIDKIFSEHSGEKKE